MSRVVNYICIVDFVKGKMIAAFLNRAIFTVGGQHGSCRQTVSISNNIIIANS